MTDITQGGMAKNPFGGEDRIDHINLMEYLQANVPADKVLFLRIIQDAASNYLFAFLGKNGTTPEEFFYTHRYFFKILSTDRTTWGSNRTIKHAEIENGKKIFHKRVLEDNELRLMCFDKHFDLSGLSDYMHIDRFRSSLKKKRQSILTNNWEQVTAYVDSLYQREVDQIVEGNQLPLQVWKQDLLSILIDPPTPQHLANSIYIPNKLKKIKKPRIKRSQLGMYIKLYERLEAGIKTQLPTDWGPLTTLLEGSDNVQSVGNNSSNSVLCSSNGRGTTT